MGLLGDAWGAVKKAGKAVWKGAKQAAKAIGNFVQDQIASDPSYGAWGWFLHFIGYGAGLHIFIVDEITGPAVGCSWPVLNNYVLVDGDALSTTMAHEIGHHCYLWHTSSPTNLMTPGSGDMVSGLSRSQECMVRASKYATYFNP